MYKKQKSRSLRRKETFGEKILWENLRNRKFNGLKFRRQHPIDKYIVDFFCYEKNIIIEIDGPFHKDEEKKFLDGIRQNYLESLGYKILRFKDYEITNYFDKVMMTIGSFIENL